MSWLKLFGGSRAWLIRIRRGLIGVCRDDNPVLLARNFSRALQLGSDVEAELKQLITERLEVLPFPSEREEKG
jgi:hypothetical protein